jgi:hypothetical protein
MAAQNSVIEQAPLYETLPVGQEIIFVVSNNNAVANETKVKFVVDVHISASIPPDTNTTNDLIGTFKVTPNNSGVGMINVANIVENYVSADNMAHGGSKFKTLETNALRQHPLHLIDKFSGNTNLVRYMVIKFSVEYLSANTGVVTEDGGTEALSSLYLLWNGYLKYTDELIKDIGTAPINWFGWDPTPFYPAYPLQVGVPEPKFLTNAPSTQYANPDDYGTFAFFARNQDMWTATSKIKLNYYASDGTLLDSQAYTRNANTGSAPYATYDAHTRGQIYYVGAFPGNLRNWSTVFDDLITDGSLDGGYYTIALNAQNQSPDSYRSIELYTIYLNCPNTKGYESIRMCWLNQWGAWDYYTFTQKSIRKTSTKGSTYQQLEGNWSGSNYFPVGYKGGKKAFRRDATESITMNTDFVSESENVMFEELTNSPEVYILKGYEATTNNYDTLNRYVIPVTLKNSSFTKKTVANDKLIQYSFEVEKSKTLRTQSI